jgi:2'-5' RNA ligase
VRLFVAVNFPASVRKALANLASELSGAELPVRWTPEPNFHLTLRWLGNQDAAAADLLSRILVETATDAEPFEAGFGAVGAFPSPRRPRVIWIAVEAGPRLRLLRDQLERRLAAEGFGRDERSFRPHVTLGRARRAARPGAFRTFVSASGNLRIDQSVPVQSIDLMRSHTEPEGARYERLARAVLGAGLPGEEAEE